MSEFANFEERTDGGPAFPTHMLNVPLDEADDPKHNGMSIRAWLAGQALPGIIIASQRLYEISGHVTDKNETAQIACATADALLAELAKAQEPDHA